MFLSFRHVGSFGSRLALLLGGGLLVLTLSGCPGRDSNVRRPRVSPTKTVIVPLKKVGPLVRFPALRMSRNPSRGPQLAPLRVVEFLNPLSSDSKALHRLRSSFLRAFPGQVRWTVMFNPVVGKDRGYFLAKSLVVAREMGGFWRLLSTFMASPGAPPASYGALLAQVRKSGLNSQEFDVRMQNPLNKVLLDRDMRVGFSAGHLGESVLYLNGAKLTPPWSKATLLRAARIAFANAQGHLKRGIPLRRLHSFLVRNAKPVKARPGVPDEIRPRMYKRLAMSVFEQTPFQGLERSPLPVLEYSDFSCSPCRTLYLRLHSVIRSLPTGLLRFYFKPYPVLRSVQSRKAVELLAAAQERGRYWQMVHTLFKHQRELMKGNYLSLARKAGLDTNWVASELDRGSFRVQALQFLSSGRRARVRGVPTLFIDGWRLVGAQSKATLRKELERELWKAGVPMRKRARGGARP